MAVNAIQKKEYNSHKASYVKAAAAGAVGGYVLKTLLPLNQSEKDDKYVRDYFESSAKRAVKGHEIKVIRNTEKKTEAQIEALKLVDSKDVKISKIKALKEPTKTQVVEIIKGIQEAARGAKSIGKKAFVAFTKSIRPTGTFMATGAGLAVATAFVYNVLQKISED